MQSFIKTIPVDTRDAALYGAVPDHAPVPGIVVIQHAPGVDTFLQTMVNRLADAGFAAAAPDLYHRQTPNGFDPMGRMGQLKDREVEADVNAAVDFLRAEPGVDRDRIGILGYCMGGRVAYLMAAANPHFKAAVVYYGGNIKKPWGEDVSSPFARTREIHCPLLFHFGEEDTNPSPDDMRDLDAELSRHDKAHVFHTYSNAGHAFMNFTNAERYREDASKVSWPRTLDFFGKYLR